MRKQAAPTVPLERPTIISKRKARNVMTISGSTLREWVSVRDDLDLQPSESVLQADVLRCLGLSARVIDIASEAEMHVIQLPNGQTTTRTPDIRTTTTNRTCRTYLDTKPLRQLDEEAKENLRISAEACEAAGHRHLVLTEKEIYAGWAVANAKLLELYRLPLCASGEKARLEKVLKALVPSLPRPIRAVISDGIAESDILTLIGSRRLFVDHRHPLRLDSTLHATQLEERADAAAFLFA